MILWKKKEKLKIKKTALPAIHVFKKAKTRYNDFQIFGNIICFNYIHQKYWSLLIK